jgi:hypothetical protein
VNGDKSEVARVNVNYKDELSDGSNRSASGIAKIVFTDDQKISDKSVNGAVNAEKELMLTAVAKDEAIAQADAGNYQQAATILKAQSAALKSAYAAAPGTVQGRIRAETNNLDSFSGVIGGGDGFNSATRKSLQSQSYNTRNSK